jgi:CBS-domain-containing membrane protein
MLLDPKFTHNKSKYLIQCTLGTISMLAILIVLNQISVSAVVASMGASCFISFLMPHAHTARPRSLIGGYVVGILCGCAFNLLSYSRLLTPLLAQLHDPHIATASLAVGCSMLGMAITNTEHPPAAGLALGLVYDEISIIRIIIILAGIVCLTGIKTILKPFMIDLL